MSVCIRFRLHVRLHPIFVFVLCPFQTGGIQCKRNGAAEKKNKKRTKKKQKNHVFEEEEEHAKRERGTRQKHRPFLVRCGPDFLGKLFRRTGSGSVRRNNFPKKIGVVLVTIR